MKRFPAALAVVALLALAGCSHDDDAESFAASLSGSNEVPAKSTSATGAASFTIDGDRVSFVLEVGGIDHVTMAHIHTAAAGANGPIRVFLFNGPERSVGSRQVLAQGTFVASDVTGITFPELLQAMRAGEAYVNVHTVQNPTGEIRGQIQLGR